MLTWHSVTRLLSPAQLLSSVPPSASAREILSPQLMRSLAVRVVTSVSGSITRGGCLDGGWWVTCDEISWKGPNQVGRWVGVARWPHHVTLWGAGHVLLSAGAGYIVSAPLHHTHYKPGDTPTHVIIMLVLLVVR